MKLQYAAGIDIGTQGTKAALFSLDGRKVSETFERSRLIYGGPGEVCQNAGDIYGSVLRTVSGLMKKNNVPPEQVAAIGIDGQMAGIMAVDSDFEAVGPYDSWLDTRCEPYINKMKDKAGDEVVRRTGGQITYAHGPKILWRKAERQAEYEKIAKFVLPGVYVAGKLCGLKAEDAWIDYTHLHFSGFADNRRKQWDEGLLSEFGIGKERMPEIVSPWKIVGRLTEQAAKACGLTPETKVAAGCGDSAASALGAGIVEKDMIYDVAGTASIFSCSTDRFTPDLESETLLFSRSVIDGLYTPLAYIGGGGLCLKWFLEQNGKDYAYWNEQAEKLEAGCGGLYFVPHFSGRTCPNDPRVRGAYWGLSFQHTAAHMYRSIMESIACEYAYYFSILKRQNPGISPKYIYGAGGGARSRIFCQIKADALGVPYRPLREADTAVYASAMLAAYGVGIIDDLKAAMKPSLGEETVLPDKDRYEIYRKKKKNYVNLLETLGTFRGEIRRGE